MRSPSFPVCLLLNVLALTTRTTVEASTDTNSTQMAVEEEEDESLSNITLEEFKERYRRLIPYMTFYVANNYVGGQATTPKSTLKEFPSGAPLRKTQQVYTRVNNAPNRANNRRVNTQSQEKKFIPSMQYDPRDVGSDNDYFTPIRYSEKISYEDYPALYQPQQNRKATYSELTTGSSQISRNENRYYSNVRPQRPYTTNGRNHLPRKQLAKPGHLRDDYLVDYNARPGGNNNALNYPVKDYQGLRHPLPSPVYPNAPVQAQEPLQVLRNPNVNLNQIAESLHLSERLPEMLNKDNFDYSLRTLLEILNILHNSKKEGPQTPSLVQTPSAPRFPQKPLNYENFKPRPQTRPKVITETRFQVTPNPLYLTEDPERFKVSYEDEILPAPPPSSSPPNYSMNNHKLVEYYPPIAQNVRVMDKEVFLPTIRPQTHDRPDNSYEITEDLSDDVVQQGRFTLPQVTTQSTVHTYTEPTKTSTPKLNATPQPSVKYGATQGMANVDYPAYSIIPATNFSCKEQRYKGFFGDPDTGCQVWHYCDLNGGKSSFLCPNGTIFSQVALTCDWWFNVKCETTTQLYVLNERLYKYILPVMPKFPEDFTGPEVDRYLELKFKEMEAKLKEKKLKKQKDEKEKLKDKAQTQKEDE